MDADLEVAVLRAGGMSGYPTFRAQRAPGGGPVLPVLPARGPVQTGGWWSGSGWVVTGAPWFRQRGMWWRVVRAGPAWGWRWCCWCGGCPGSPGSGGSQILQPLRGLSPVQWLLLAGFTQRLVGVHLHDHRGVAGDLPCPRVDREPGRFVVANTLPFGGALGIAATYTICRSWRFSRLGDRISVLLGGVFAMAGKVLVPLIGLAALVLHGDTIGPVLRNAALLGCCPCWPYCGVGHGAGRGPGRAHGRRLDTTDRAAGVAAAGAAPGAAVGGRDHRAAGADPRRAARPDGWGSPGAPSATSSSTSCCSGFACN